MSSTEYLYPDEEFVAAATDYAATFPAEEHPDDIFIKPKKRFVLVTCMDCRIDVFRILRLDPEDAHIIRNAGASAREAIRSIVVSQHLLNTNKIIVMKHTRCGMRTTRRAINETIACNIGVTASHIDFKPFVSLEEAVRDDIEFLLGHELLIPGQVRGYIYNVDNGKMRPVPYPPPGREPPQAPTPYA